jgi:hypothetical protein
MLRWLRVSFRQAENAGPVDWPYPRSHRGAFPGLVDAAAFHRLMEDAMGDMGRPTSGISIAGGHPGQPRQMRVH